MNYVRLIKSIGGLVFFVGLARFLLGGDSLTALLLVAAGGSVFMMAYLWEDPGPIQ